jgi:LysR family nitrogen assimilation transcriptional regulator
LIYSLCTFEISKWTSSACARPSQSPTSARCRRRRCGCISQSALSRQIADLEYECGFNLFDRIGRRLFLTTRGEQLLGECRGVLGQIGSLGERIELLKRGNSGVLKLAAPPQTIESVLVGFLPRYAKSFPNVRVKLTEALGMDQVPLLERGEVHIGIRHDQGVNPWFESFALPSDDVLAA